MGLHVCLVRTGAETAYSLILLLSLFQTQQEANLHTVTHPRLLARSGVSGCDPSSWQLSLSEGGSSQGDARRSATGGCEFAGAIHQRHSQREARPSQQQPGSHLELSHHPFRMNIPGNCRETPNSGWNLSGCFTKTTDSPLEDKLERGNTETLILIGWLSNQIEFHLY